MENIHFSLCFLVSICGRKRGHMLNLRSSEKTSQWAPPTKSETEQDHMGWSEYNTS